MNLELLQTVDQSYPEHNDGVLDSGSEALTCMFNRRGTLLAVGCNDGRVAVWDFMTRGLARICNAHIHPITSLSWNRSGCKLLSSSTDWNVILWDVASGDIDLKFLFPSPVLKAQFHPRKTGKFLVCLMKNVPVLVTRGNDNDYKHSPLPIDGEPELNIVASFDRRGDRIVTGSSKGKVLIIDSETLTVLKSFKLAATAIKTIEFARRGSNFLVNSADRVIRVFDIERIMADPASEVEALQRLQDLVNRTQWKKCTFSGDGEFIVAGSHRQHALYIWDKATGSLVKMLTGQKGETLLDIVWHPVRPIILSISNGVVTVWSQTQVELWSAYAPNFKELTENEEYGEREDEFDIEDEDSVLKRDEDGYGAEAALDMERVQPIPAFCSSDSDSEAPLDWLPMAPEIEDPEEPGWGQLEPSLNELPSVPGSRKRQALEDDANGVTDSDLPKAKQPRTIEIELSRSTDEKHAESSVDVKKAAPAGSSMVSTQADHDPPSTITTAPHTPQGSLATPSVATGNQDNINPSDTVQTESLLPLHPSPSVTGSEILFDKKKQALPSSEAEMEDSARLVGGREASSASEGEREGLAGTGQSSFGACQTSLAPSGDIEAGSELVASETDQSVRQESRQTGQSSLECLESELDTETSESSYECPREPNTAKESSPKEMASP